MSRFPIEQPRLSGQVSAIDAFYSNQLDSLPVTAAMVRKQTRKDCELVKVYDYALRGWPTSVSQPLQPYYNRRTELSLCQGCLIWGTRVVIPTSLRKPLLQELHTGHLGIVRMKGIARSFIWWPGIDKDIESTAAMCNECLCDRRMPPSSVHQWERPPGPWIRIHADFLGPVAGKMLHLVVDAYSKWPEVFIMKDTTAAQTIEVFRMLFATWGLPQQLHSDNGPQFVSAEFEHFLKSNGVIHTTSAVYHPNSNGQAERFVSTLKHALKTQSDPVSLQTKISRFLLTYRTAVNNSTGELPSVLMLRRRLRTRLDLVKPAPRNYKLEQRADRIFEIGQAVMIRDYRHNKPKWIHGIIIQKHGSLMYIVEVTTQVGKAIWRRHTDQLIAREEETTVEPNNREIRDHKLAQTPTVVQPAFHRYGTSTTAPSAPIELTTPMVTNAVPDTLTNEQPTTTVESRNTTQLPATVELATSTQNEVTRDNQQTVYTSSHGRKIIRPLKLQDFVLGRN